MNRRQLLKTGLVIPSLVLVPKLTLANTEVSEIEQLIHTIVDTFGHEFSINPWDNGKKVNLCVYPYPHPIGMGDIGYDPIVMCAMDLSCGLVWPKHLKLDGYAMSYRIGVRSIAFELFQIKFGKDKANEMFRRLKIKSNNELDKKFITTLSRNKIHRWIPNHV